VRLNQIEATVLISCQIHELIRKGQDPLSFGVNVRRIFYP
jgi:urease gamma subunit